eukprot:gene14103-36548_t
MVRSVVNADDVPPEPHRCSAGGPVTRPARTVLFAQVGGSARKTNTDYRESTS